MIMCLRTVLLLVTLGSCVIRFATARAIVTVVDSSPWTYRARVAAFGEQMEVGVANTANLLLPPDTDDPFLCAHPDEETLKLSLESLRDDGLPPSDEIALFVSRGECSFETKARNALAIQKNVTDLLRYLIVYNNDPDYSNDLVVMSASSPDEELEDLKSLGLVFVSTSTGSDVLRKIAKLSDSNGQSPNFLSTDSGGWRMPLLVERLPPPEQSGGQSGSTFTSGNRGSNGSTAFYWLRFVLFALLVIAPCFRASYLWYGGGGRLLLRRNESGRIVGLQYVRPRPYWFAGGAVSNNMDQSQTELLTEDEVLALPEIGYTQPSPNAGQAEGELIEKEQMLSTDEEQPTISHEESENLSASDSEGGGNLTTCCTTCSICIDDFQEGERIRLLPRCRHAFHTDCIMPWLTERQGCCPLCKTNVLHNEHDTDTDTDADETSEASQS